MYVIPFIVVLIIALAIFFSPLLAVILLIVALFGIGGVKFLGGASAVDPENAPAETPRGGAGGGSERKQRESPEGGIWGETWPEQREE